MFMKIVCTALVLAGGLALAPDSGADREVRRAEMQAQAKAAITAASAGRSSVA